MSDSKSFCLQWDKFSSSCTDAFQGLLASQEFSDVTLYCGGKFIKCHRVILSASSQFFKTLLVSVAQPNAIIAVPNIEVTDLEAIITFIYTGQVTVSCNQLDSLVKTGELLKVNGLGEEDKQSESRPESAEEESVARNAKRKRTDQADTTPFSKVEIPEPPTLIPPVPSTSVKQELSVTNYIGVSPHVEPHEEYEEEDFAENEMNASALESFQEEDVSYLEAGNGGVNQSANTETGNGPHCGGYRQIDDVVDNELKLLIQTGFRENKPVLDENHLQHITTLRVCLICQKNLAMFSKGRRPDHYAKDHAEFLLKPLEIRCGLCPYSARSNAALESHCRRRHKNSVEKQDKYWR